MERRDFLKSLLLGSTGLILAVHSGGCYSPSKNWRSEENLFRPNSFISITGDGSVTLYSCSSEIGQGAQTGLAILLAEELRVPLESVVVEMPALSPYYGNPAFGGMMMTGGSRSISGLHRLMREAGATAYASLLHAAHRILEAPKSDITWEYPQFSAQGKSITLGEAAREAAKHKLQSFDALKKPEEFTLIGKPQNRVENIAKVTGTATFGIDQPFPEGHEGRIAYMVHYPALDAAAPLINKEELLQLEEVEDVIEVLGGIALVGHHVFPLSKAARKVQFDDSSSATNSEELLAELSASPEPTYIKEHGDHKAPEGATNLTLEYSCPFIEHATMEPMNATAHFQDGTLTLWVPTQVQSLTQQQVAKALGISKKQVVVNTTFCGGGFGRRLETDYAVQAAQVAKAIEKPVKLIWNREETTRHGFYRPMTHARFDLTFDQSRELIGWENTLGGHSIAIRYIPKTILGGNDLAVTEGADQIHYEIPNFRFNYQLRKGRLELGSLRSVGNTHTGFYVESAIDEAAHYAQVDPLEYRLQKTNNSQYRDVLNALKKLSNWGETPDGVAQGVAVHHCFGSTVGTVCDLSIQDQKIRIHRLCSVIDCGQAINPDMIKAQIEGSYAFGLTMALYSKITIKEGMVHESNFHNYKIVKLKDLPQNISIEILQNHNEPGGVGEPGVPPVAPALTNAIFQATGTRIRQLPLAEQGWSLDTASLKG